METEDLEKVKDDILFEAFSVLFASENSRWTERSEARRFNRWKTEHAKAIDALPWERIVPLYDVPNGVTFHIWGRRMDLVFSIAKNIRASEEYH